MTKPRKKRPATLPKVWRDLAAAVQTVPDAEQYSLHADMAKGRLFVEVWTTAKAWRGVERWFAKRTKELSDVE